jgi:ribonuclease P protein component
MDFSRAPKPKTGGQPWRAAAPRDANAFCLRGSSYILPATVKPNESLPRASILRLRSDLARIKEEGRRVAGANLALNYSIDTSRKRMTAFIVPKARGNAVARNRIRRRLRESYRRLQRFLPRGLQSVWIARSKAAAANYRDLRTEMITLCKRAHLLDASSGFELGGATEI